MATRYGEMGLLWKVWYANIHSLTDSLWWRLLGISNFDLFFLGRRNIYVMKLLRHPYFLFMNNTRHFLVSCLKAWIIFSIFCLKAWIIFSTKLSKGKRPRRKTWKSKQRQRFNVNNLTFHFGNFEDRLFLFKSRAKSFY